MRGERNDMSDTKKEYDPSGKPAHEAGSKMDGGKISVFQGFIRYFPRAITAVAEVSDYGANKYSRGGWLSVDNGFTRYADAQHRHSIQAAMGELYDQESKLLHAAHEAWNALAKLELMLRDSE